MRGISASSTRTQRNEHVAIAGWRVSTEPHEINSILKRLNLPLTRDPGVGPTKCTRKLMTSPSLRQSPSKASWSISLYEEEARRPVYCCCVQGVSQKAGLEPHPKCNKFVCFLGGGRVIGMDSVIIQQFTDYQLYFPLYEPPGRFGAPLDPRES